MTELPTGEYLIHSLEEYEQAIQHFMSERIIKGWWRDKIDTTPTVFPCVCRIIVFPDFWDMTAIFTPLQEYKDAAEKIWREIEALC